MLPTAPHALFLLLTALGSAMASCRLATAYDLHFDYTSFESTFGQAQFDVLNYPSINGNYMMTSTDNHRPEMVANGNNLAEFYNWLQQRYEAHPVKDGALSADEIDAYVVSNSTRNGPKPTWLVLNEISASLWPPNAGVPGNSTYRTWLLDCVTRLHEHYGYNVVTYSPFQNPGANDASWQALAEVSYIGIECYLSGPEVWNSGNDYASRVAWAQGQYQASKTSYLSRGVPEEKLFVSEHFANNNSVLENGTPVSWGRAGMASPDQWDSVIQIRQDAIFNVGFEGFLAYSWGGNGMGVSQAEQIQHEYYYRSRRVLPSQKPQWLSDAPINVNGVVIPLSWNQPLNWLGGVPNADGAEANFWRTITAPRTITLDGAKTVGKLSIDSPFSYAISPGTGGSITFRNVGSTATLAASQGVHVLGVDIHLANNVNAVITAGTVAVTGVLTGAGSLTKSGAGVLILQGDCLYTGDAMVTGGTLRVGGTLNTPGGAVSIAPGALLEASGDVLRAIVNDGTVAGPTAAGLSLRLSGQASGAGDYTGNIAFAGGFSPGIAATSVTLGGMTLESGNTLTMHIGGRTQGLQHDHLDVGSHATLGGTLTVSFINNITPQAGDTFNLFDWAAASGGFQAIHLPALSGLAWDQSQLLSQGTLTVRASADFNADGYVNAADLDEWDSEFGVIAGSMHQPGDADGDGDVDGADFLLWQRQLGAGPVASALPEPRKFALLGAAIILLAAGLRRIAKRAAGRISFGLTAPE